MNQKPTIVQVSLKDKYLSYTVEPRIGRYQFLVRVLVPVIISAFVAAFASSLVSPDINIIVLLLFTLVSYPILAMKRCHDFGKNGKIIASIILILLICSVFMTFYAMYQSIYGDISSMIILESDNINGSISLHLSYAEYLIMGILVLLPGNKDTNIYGDPNNTKVGLLG